MGYIFTIFGFGEVGSMVASLLNATNTNSTFNIIEIQTTISGRVLDFQHAATCRENKVLYNSKENIVLSDFIVYSAGYSNVHGESRNSVATKNKELVYDLFSTINFQKKTTIIVVTNPVDSISYWLNDAVKGKINVLGTGTSLDAFRLKFILSKYFNCDVSKIITSVIGEHGQHMVPLYSETYIDGIKITQKASQEELNAITEELILSAFKIRETEAATKYGIAQTCIEIINHLLSPEKSILPLSIELPDKLKDEFSFTTSLFISLPCIISSEGVKHAEFNFSKHEKDAFQTAINSIQKIILEST